MARSFILSKPKACKVDSVAVMSLDDALKNLARAVGDNEPMKSAESVEAPARGDVQKDVIPVTVIGIHNGEEIYKRSMMAPAKAKAVKTISLGYKGYEPWLQTAAISNGEIIVSLRRSVEEQEVLKASIRVFDTIPDWDDVAKFRNATGSTIGFLDEMLSSFFSETKSKSRFIESRDDKELVSALMVSDVVIGYTPNEKTAAACIARALMSDKEVAKALVDERLEIVINKFTSSDISEGIVGLFSLMPMSKVKARVEIVEARKKFDKKVKEMEG